MTKLTRAGSRGVEICRIEDADNGQLQIELRLGPKLAERVRVLGKGSNDAVCRAIRVAIMDLLPAVPVRLSVHLPVAVVARLDAVAQERRTSKGRLLFAQVSRYVDEEGEFPRANYPNRRRPYPYCQLPEAKLMTQLQIAVPNAQAQGFRKFCRSNGMTQSAFFALETEQILKNAAIQNKAAGLPKAS